MNTMKFPSGRFRYSNLCRLAFICLSLPHSNAETERCFSLVRKVQSDYRGQLNNQTLNSLLNVRINLKTECFRYEATKEVLEKAKKASVEYNKKCAEKALEAS